MGFWSKISLWRVLVNAQMRMAIHATGTMTDLARNSHRSLFGCMTKKGSWKTQKMRNEPRVASSMPSHAGIRDGRVKNDGHMAPIIARTVFAPFMVWIANQKVARMTREIMAMYEPQNPQEARAITGKEAWCITPIAPLKAI